MENVPLDVFYPTLAHLDRHDLVNVTLVSSAFNRVATPLLYRTLDSRITAEKVLLHPCTTLLRRPDLALHVRKVTETGAVQLFRRVNPKIIENITTALRLCTHLETADYIDDTDTPVLNFMPILQALVTLPLKALVIRTRHDIGEEAWALLNNFKGIRRLAVWSMDSGPPRVLQGWADVLGSTLEHLDLGRCAGVPPTVLISVFSKLPLLRELKLNGAPSAAIPAIIGCLPNLVALDTEYLGFGNYRVSSTPLPALKRLTVRTGSVDLPSLDRLWTWMRSLLPHVASLESFTLNSFPDYGRAALPWPFIVFLATKQGHSLQELNLGAALLNLDALSLLSLECPTLQTVDCTVASPDVESIAKAVSRANSLRSLHLHVIWIEDGVASPLASDVRSDFSEDPDESEDDTPLAVYARLSSKRTVDFTEEGARSMMLRPGSKLRSVKLGDSVYTGRWMLARTDSGGDGCAVFEVVRDTTRSVL